MTEFAICELDVALAATVTVQMAQAPGKAVATKISGSGFTDSTPLRFVINEFGKIDCDATGDEFRPLQEKDKYNRNNPYQDPARGRLPSVTADGTGAIPETITQNVLLNLEGKNSIMGRSILLFDDSTDVDGAIITEEPVACCIIGVDASPPLPTPTFPVNHGQYHQQPQPNHAHGHGHTAYYQPPTQQLPAHSHYPSTQSYGSTSTSHSHDQSDFFGGMHGYMSMPQPRYRPSYSRYGRSY